MWVPPEDKDPVLLHAPTRKSIALFGAVQIRSGKLITMTASPFNSETFAAFLQLLARHRDRRRRTVFIADNAAITVRQFVQIPFSWTTFRLTVPHSTPSNVSGNSSADCASIISTSTRSIISYKKSLNNSSSGHDPMKRSRDYAVLLKTPCIKILPLSSRTVRTRRARCSDSFIPSDFRILSFVASRIRFTEAG